MWPVSPALIFGDVHKIVDISPSDYIFVTLVRYEQAPPNLAGPVSQSNEDAK